MHEGGSNRLYKNTQNRALCYQNACTKVGTYLLVEIEAVGCVGSDVNEACQTAHSNTTREESRRGDL